MSDRTELKARPSGPSPRRNTGASLTTPAGLEANAMLNLRRAACPGLERRDLGGAAAVGRAHTFVGRLDARRRPDFHGFVFGTPWAVLGFWNASSGCGCCTASAIRSRAVAPYLEAAQGDRAAEAQNRRADDLAQRGPGAGHVAARNRQGESRATGEGGAFSYFLLSDTDRDESRAPRKSRGCGASGEQSRDRGAHRLSPARRTTPASRPATCANSARRRGETSI